MNFTIARRGPVLYRELPQSSRFPIKWKARVNVDMYRVVGVRISAYRDNRVLCSREFDPPVKSPRREIALARAANTTYYPPCILLAFSLVNDFYVRFAEPRVNSIESPACARTNVYICIIVKWRN